MKAKTDLWENKNDSGLSDCLIHLRAHHGMCLAFFQGIGYSKTFSGHMAEVKDRLSANPEIQICACADVICSACPHNRDGVCESSEKTAEYDRQVMLQCGLQEGVTIHYEEFKELIKERILLPGKRREICGDCEWDDLCQ